MGLKILRFKISHRSTTRHMLLRALLIVSALSVVPLMQILPGIEGVLSQVAGGDSAVNLPFWGSFLLSGTKCFLKPFLAPVWGTFESEQCKENLNVTANVVSELMGLKLLSYDAKSLCIGQGSASAISELRELGFSDAHGVYRHPLFSFKHKKLVYELEFEEKSFDFVFSGNLDQVNSPALLILEIERVLKPGGIGAVLVSATGASNSNNLVKSATSISSLLKESSVVRVTRVDKYILVVFKRRLMENASYFDVNPLPGDCESALNNKPYIDLMEPLLEEKPADFVKRITYLPTVVDISSRKRLVYIDIGAAEHLNANLSSWFLPSYPINTKAFNVYFVDHNTSVMLSYVKKPGITFVYHPGLTGNKDRAKNLDAHEDLEPFPEDEGFDFLAWFKETVQYADFVVLKMNASEAELNFLWELYKTGAICFIDELFLRCSNRSDCTNIFKGLRSSGIFAHQWWED